MLAARACEVPYASLSVRLEGLCHTFSKTAWSVDDPDPFAGYVMRHRSEVFVIPDTLLDDRFCGEFQTGGPRVRFYAGVAVRDWNGRAVGTLSVMGECARTLTAVQEEVLYALSRQATAQVELFQGLEQLSKRIDELHASQGHLLVGERLTLLGRLSACIAHEVNNPLSSVISNLAFVSEELTRGGVSRIAEVQEALCEAREGAERIRHTVQAVRRLEYGE